MEGANQSRRVLPLHRKFGEHQGARITRKMAIPSAHGVFAARSQTAVPWNSACLDSACTLGSFAASALCEWAAADTVCIFPSRWLGSGLPAGALTFEHLAEVLPPHMLAYIDVRARTLANVLYEGQMEAWATCPASPSLAPGMQVAGLRYTFAAPCEGGGSSSSESDSVLEVIDGGKFVPVGDNYTLRVLTLAPAVPLFQRSTEASGITQHVPLSAQHVLADYIRAHSPLSTSTFAMEERIVVRANPAIGSSGQRSPVPCPPSACARKVARIHALAAATPLLPEAHIAAAHDASVQALTVLLPMLLVVLCVAAWSRWVRRPRIAAETKARSGVGSSGPATDETSPLATDEMMRATAAVPPSPLAPSYGSAHSVRSPRSEGDAQPLRTGSQRLISIEDLAP